MKMVWKCTCKAGVLHYLELHLYTLAPCALHPGCIRLCYLCSFAAQKEAAKKRYGVVHQISPPVTYGAMGCLSLIFSVLKKMKKSTRCTSNGGSMRIDRKRLIRELVIAKANYAEYKKKKQRKFYYGNKVPKI